MCHSPNYSKSIHLFNSNSNPVRCVLLLFPFYSPGNWGPERFGDWLKNHTASHGRARGSARAVYRAHHSSGIGKPLTNMNTCCIPRAFLKDPKYLGEREVSPTMWIITETPSSLGNTCPFSFYVIKMITLS